MTSVSLTTRVLAEVAPHVPPLRCCRAALVEGMRAVSGGDIDTTRLVAARAALGALHQLDVNAHVERHGTARRHRHRVVGGEPPVAVASDQPCCQRSRLRGAFLVGGRVSAPAAAPRVEVDCREPAGAERVVAWLADLGLDGRVTAARSGPRVLVQRAGDVGDLLSCIGAQGARLSFEEGRVLRDVGGALNRQLNAETANLRRTVAAGLSQLAAIEALEEAGRLAALPPALREAAELRRRHPSLPLDGLAELALCSRPAMAGRLSRLVALARATGAGC